ncbi:lysis system i-spanin subunit Rz [Luteibacter yeojuensis]|uniref:Endopeptidase n=1 Tax=Luteibacter yeojuensis TaxID=345309 RepID=A0A7X5QS10_9GAMM|nr:lysis system i-spanin subunit Rz [Luteibacter yeojuensis]NID14368.1 endopeptidase [Luteibacter yeojuensis]
MKWVKWGLVVAVAAGLFGLGHHMAAADGAERIATLKATYAEQAKTAADAALERERKQAADFAATAQQYEKDKADAKATSDRVVADLRSGALRLRDRWATQVLAGQAAVAAGSGQPDAGADDRAASAGRIVRAAAQCDAQVRGLQDILKAERADESLSPSKERP